MKIKAREKTLFESCTCAFEKKDSDRANIFANELTEVKKVSKTISNGMLLLEQLTLRMETLKEVGLTFAQLRPTLEIVKQISGQLTEVMPEVSNELSNIGSILDETLVGMNIDSCQETIMRIPESVLSNDILEEASNVLRMKVEEEIPLPPKDEQVAPAIMIGCDEEEFMDGVGGLKVVSNITKNISNSEGAVLVYLRSNSGDFDMGECSQCCKIPESQIPAIIEGLSRKGMIKIMTV